MASKPPLYDLEQEHLLGTAIGFAVFAYPPFFGGLFLFAKKFLTFFKKEPIILRLFLQLHGERTFYLSRNLKTEYTDHQVRTLR